MKNQTTQQLLKQSRFFKNSWIMVLFIVIIIIIGSSMYLWHQLSLKTVKQNSQGQIMQLKNQIDTLQEQNTQLKNSINNIQLPVISYSRAWLLYNDEKGLAEKRNLEEKLINPYIDYHNEDRINLVALHITVPQNIREEYKVLVIFGSEKQYGSDEFLFGTREQDYDYWRPGCMGPCNFSEEFKAKYPQIVE